MKLQGLDEMPKPKELMALGEVYKPYRSVAAWYMWRAVENIKDKPRGRLKAKKAREEESRKNKNRKIASFPATKKRADMYGSGRCSWRAC